MLKGFKAVKATRDWKTTLITVVGIVLIIAGTVWPEKIDIETQEVIKSALNEIILGIGILIEALVGIFAATDG